jgi:uncharacterized protein YifN (PemK superfamily)
MINTNLEINNRFVVPWISVMSVTEVSKKHYDYELHNQIPKIQFLNQDTCLNQCKLSRTNQLSKQAFNHITLWQVAHNFTMSCSHNVTVLV